MIALITPVSHLFLYNRTFETTRHTKGLPSGPCVMVLSMAPPLGAMNNVHSGLANTTIGIQILATINSLWKTAKPDPRGLLRTVLPMILQETVTGCGDLTTNRTIVPSMRAAYKHQNRVDAGATQLISMIPFPELEMPPAGRRRRKTGGRGRKMHTPHRDRRRGRRSLRIDRPRETQQTSIQHIYIAPNLLRSRSFRRKQQGVLMGEARKGILELEKEMGLQWHLRRSNSIMSSDMLFASERG